MADDSIQPIVPPITPVAAPAPTADGVTAPPLPAAAAEAAPDRPPSLYRSVKEFFFPQQTGHVHQVESWREIVETVVFVVVLVLLLKSFAAEAFVIPTGSMAETLWGYQVVVNCPECGYHFPVNVSAQVEPQRDGGREQVLSCICPNCRYQIDFKNNDVAMHWNSGDRVLVAKSLYEGGLMDPQRFQVVVFKYPAGPQKEQVPMNYIKRLIGKGRETIGIHYGNLYLLEGVEPTPEDLKSDPLERWRSEYRHDNDYSEQLKNRHTDEIGSKFKIIRKPPDKILAMKRIVFDNDHQARDLEGQPARWAGRTPGGTWEVNDTKDTHGFRHAKEDGKDIDWLGYRHILRPTEPGATPRPELITDFMGYNSFTTAGPRSHDGTQADVQDWVGDLILEANVRVEEPTGELILELAKGVDRFRAQFDLASGVCTLIRVHNDGQEEKLDSKVTTVRSKGTYHLRFANVDDRLTLWVDGSLPFGDGVAYEEAREFGPTDHDLAPASIGVRGAAVSVHKLVLWRDTYYTIRPGQADGRKVDRANPNAWSELRNLPARTMYVQPGHYLCLGDNSLESSDSREWGLVPERLMLGRALLVYYPFYFDTWPLYSPVNRAGVIR